MKNRFILFSLFFIGCTGLIQADSTPTVSRVYGDPFTAGVATTQVQGTVGDLVPTGVFGTDGSLSIDTQLSGGQAQAIEVLSDGSFLVALSKAASNSVLAKYSSVGTVNSTAQFGTSGVADLGTGTLQARAMMVDTQGRILVAGGATSGSAGWLKRVSADGDTVQTFDTTTGTPWQFIGGLAQQSTGAIVTVGFDGTNAQIARYTVGTASAAGVLDTTFGVSGFATLDGTNSYPTSTHGLYSVYVDASDNIYVLMLDSTGAGAAYIYKLAADGTNIGTQGTEVTLLSGSTEGQFRLVFDGTNLILAGQIAGTPNVVKVTARTVAGAATATTFTNFLTSSINADSFALGNLMTASDGKIYIVGSDTSTADMVIIRLMGVSSGSAYYGLLDNSTNDPTNPFNGAFGYNLFNISDPDTTSTIQSVSVAPTGQLYTTGYQINTGTTVPYVSVLYNDLNVSQVAQFPATIEQGILDQTFGTPTRQTYAGVVTPFNGSYGPSLMQQAQSVIEITTTPGAGAGVPVIGDILVGMNGYTDASANESMMLAWLASDGTVNTDINSAGAYPGYLTLAHDTTGGFSTTYPHEYLTSTLQGVDGVVYVSGYASATLGGAAGAATLRAYSAAGTATWTTGTANFYAAEPGVNYTALAVGTQAFPSSSTRILLFVQDSATTGHISGYTTSGSLDTAGFGITGIIPTSNGAYPGLAMGPVYGGVVTTDENIVVAYKNSGSAAIDVAMFAPDGSALQSSFGSSGIVSNIFSSATITLDNVRTCFQAKSPHDNIIVAGATSTALKVASLSPDTGVADWNVTLTITGVTSIKLKEIVGVSDGTLMATFYDVATDNTMYAARITAAGALDTTFNAQGSQPGVLPIQIGNEVTNYSNRVMTSSLIQSTTGANKGNIVLAGYESLTASDTTPMVMRSFGTSGTTEVPFYPVSDTSTPGTLAAAFDLATALGTGQGKAVYTYPAGNTYQGMMLVGYDNGTDSKIARIDVSSQALDSTFGTAGIYTITGLPGITCVTVDANNYILAGGTTSAPLGWACQITPTATGGTPQINMTMPTSPTTISGVNQILQQKSGRYIVAATHTTSSIGVLIAFQDKLVSPATTLEVDPTFNPQGTGGVDAGQCNVGSTTGLYTLAIDSNDTIAVAYKNTTVYVGLFTANGSGYSTTLNTGGSHAPFNTTMLADNSAVITVGFDNQSPANIVVASSYNDGTPTNQVQVARYVVSTGAIDGGFNGGAIKTISNLGTAGVTLADMMQTTTQQTVLVGYNTAGGNGRLFAARLTSAGALDSTWNPSPTGTDTAGVLTYASGTTPEASTLFDAAITINGNIVSIGGTATGTGGDEILTFIYGDTYVTEQAQQPLEAAAGTLDLTIPGGSSGAWSMTTIPAAAPQKIYIYNTTVNSSANGAMLIAASNGTDSYVTQLNSDLSLNSSFGTTGVATISAKDNLHDMFVANGTNDTSQPIYVTGDSDGLMWASKISSDGDTITTFTSAVSSSIGRVIRQTTNSRILVAGFNGTNACIYALKNDLSGLDESFGDAGSYVVTGVTNEIYAMTIDEYDRIYIAYLVSGATTTINVDCILANGTGLDTTFSTAGRQTMTATTAWSATQIRLVLDMTNDILTVVAQDGTAAGNILKVARFSTAFATYGDAVGTANTMTIASKVLNLSDVFVDTQTNPDLYVIGYNSTDSKSVVGRFTTTATTVALDGTYAADSTPAGVANVTAGSMTVVAAGALDPDRRVYLVGTSGTATSRYMARLFGDVYTTQMSQATFEQIHGQIDLTLDGSAATPNGGLVLSALSGWGGLAGYTARAIIANADGSSYIAFGNGTSVIVGQVDADMNPITAFNTIGVTTPLDMATVNNMSVDSLGNIFVAGTNLGAQKVVGFSSVGALVATGATTLSSTVGTAVAQQKSGRYIIAGKIGSAGVISAYQNFSAVSGGTLPVDSTFGPATLNGYYSTGVNAQVDSLVIDDQDYIYIVYRDASNHVTLEKITANGSGKVSAANSPVAFNTGAAIDTGIVATGAATIAINSAGNIIVGAPTAAGVYTGTYNGSTGAIIGVTTQQITATAGDVLTRLVGAGTGFYGSIYNSTPTIKVFHVLSTGLLDITATAGGTGFGTSGVATFTGGSNPETSTSMNGITVQPDGKVTMVGAQAGPNPTMMRVYGYEYVPQYAQEPDQAAAGTLDTTLWPTTGALPLSAYTPISGTITTLSGSSVSRIYEYSNGNALLVFSGTNGGADTVVARVLKSLVLDTTGNGGSGFNQAGTPGSITITGQTNANALFVNASGQIFVAGGSGATSWIRAYNANGTALTGWTTPTSNLANGAYQVSQQSSDRVILAGKATTNGSLYGYTTAGDLDATFGAAGVVDMGSTAAITGMTIDYYNDIITVKTAGTTGVPAAVVLQKVQDSGGTVTTLSGGTAIATSTGAPKVILDSSSSSARIIVASATTAGFTIARYNNNATGTDNGTAITIAAGGSATSVLGNIYATSDGKVVLVGYETAGDTVVVARIASDFTLDTTFGSNGVLATTIGAVEFLARDGMICADDRIMLAGGSGASANPYLGRVFGDAYVTYVTQAPSEGVLGTLDTSWGDTVPPTGIYNYSALVTADSQGQAILALADGGYYMAMSSGTTTQVIRTVAEGGLDTDFSTDGIAESIATFVANSMMIDGSSRLVLTSSSGGAGKIARYVSGDSGALDTSFDSDGIVTISGATEANALVEQTLARYVVAGKNATGGVLYAYTALQGNQSSPGATGVLDTTFGDGTGFVQITTGGGNGIYNLIADQYDRLIFAVLNTAGTGIDLYRLTPTGELDATFGTSGKVANVITTTTSGSGFDASSIRVALDSVGNIVVAGYKYTSGSTTGNIAIAAYDNGTSTTAGANGAIWTNSFLIPNVAALTGNINVSLTDLATTADNYVLVLGNSIGASSTGSPSWIARLANTASAGTYALDSANFNPAGLNGVGSAGGIAGIFEYANTTLGTTTPYNVYNDLTVRPDGRLGVIGYENTGGTAIPTVIRVFDTPYTTETVQSPNSKVIGTNDVTLGVSPTFATNLGVTFFGISSGLASYGQVARAIALQDENNMLVAVDGASSTSAGASQIFLDMFDTDGVLNPNFNTAGQTTVLSTYTNQYVQDMITFTTVAGVNKAILAGYVTNSTLSSTDSLLLQYTFSGSPTITGTLDTTNFGGFNGNPQGIAFGDGKQINSVARQTNGRIVAAGISQDNQGLLLGYTSAGKMDDSFGNDGYLAISSTAGLFTHAVDTLNRVVVAYSDGANVVVARYLADGSGLDTTFGTASSGIFTTAISATSSSAIRVAITSSNIVVIAAVNAAGNTLTINNYNNSTAGTAFVPALSLTTFVIGKLIIDIDSKAVVVGYDTTGSDEVVIARTNTALSALDTTFNPNGAIQGCLKYAVAAGTTQVAIDAMIHPDGRILIVGSEN